MTWGEFVRFIAVWLWLAWGLRIVCRRWVHYRRRWW